jgi:hypothetical protein
MNNTVLMGKSKEKGYWEQLKVVGKVTLKSLLDR